MDLELRLLMTMEILKSRLHAGIAFEKEKEMEYAERLTMAPADKLVKIHKGAALLSFLSMSEEDQESVKATTRQMKLDHLAQKLEL